MCDYVKKTCKHCPFRNDVKPLLMKRNGIKNRE